MTEMLRPVPIDLEPKRKNRWMIEFPADLGFQSTAPIDDSGLVL